MDDNISMQQLNLQIHQLQEQAAAFENFRGELGSLEKKRIMLEQRVYATGTDQLLDLDRGCSVGLVPMLDISHAWNQASNIVHLAGLVFS